MNARLLDVETIEERVKAAPDAEALKGIIATIGTLPGSRAKLYTAQELIEHIDAAIQVPALVNRVTRTLGLRDKVLELLRQAARSPREVDELDLGATCG